MTAMERIMLRMWKNTEKADNARIAKLIPTPGIHMETDIPYINDSHRGHLLDVYYPQGTKDPLPVIIDIHGGGFMYGYKELNRMYNLYLSSLGFTVISLSYRLSPEVRVPGQLYDLNAAFHWIRENGAKYPCDMENIFVTGDSAGGFHALYVPLVDISPTLQQAYGLQPSGLNIRALGLVSGAFDLKSLLGKVLVKPAFGADYRVQGYAKYLDVKTLPDLEKIPPCYIVTSTADFVRSHSHLLARTLKERGVPYQLHDWPKGKEHTLSHVFCVTQPNWPESEQTSKEMTDWFLKYKK